ncbi:MAG: hypothetical protein UDG88_05670 [Muribaculaceae bacterium]|nr:hypothetical protein [Muribaculaceae bacterium]
MTWRHRWKLTMTLLQLQLFIAADRKHAFHHLIILYGLVHRLAVRHTQNYAFERV